MTCSYCFYKICDLPCTNASMTQKHKMLRRFFVKVEIQRWILVHQNSEEKCHNHFVDFQCIEIMSVEICGWMFYQGSSSRTRSWSSNRSRSSSDDFRAKPKIFHESLPPDKFCLISYQELIQSERRDSYYRLMFLVNENWYNSFLLMLMIWSPDLISNTSS